MKRLFSKKSGFTLVEIIVAFAVFSIMASMIIQVLNLTVSYRQSNNAYEQDLNAQEKTLIAKDKNKNYDETKSNDGTLSLKFKDKDGKDMPMDIKYQLMSADGTTGDKSGINYFVGNMVYDDQNGEVVYIPDQPTGDPNDPSEAGGGTQMSRFDTCITGSRDINYIEVHSVQKLDSNKYKIRVSADTSTIHADNRKYAQFTMYMGRSTDGLKIEKLTVDAAAGLSVRTSGINGVRVGTYTNYLASDKVIEFTVEFDKAPAEELTVNSFGSNSANGKYSKYMENTANIYGAFEKQQTPTT